RAGCGRAADLRRALVCDFLALAIDRLGLDRNRRSIGEHERVEADAEARAILELAAGFDQRHVAARAGARGDRNLTVDAQVARAARLDAILDTRGVAGDRLFEAQTDHRIRRDQQLLEARLRRRGRLRRWSLFRRQRNLRLRARRIGRAIRAIRIR